MTDLYNTQGMDRAILQDSFIENCAKNIKEDGWLALNCWIDHKNNHELSKLLKTHFNDVRALDTGSGNWVIIAGKRKNNSNAKALKATAQKLSTLLDIPLTRWLSRLTAL